MSLYIYQSFFTEDQRSLLDPAFIPWDNIENRTPHLREYPMWKNSTWKHQYDPTAYWGLFSVKYKDKTSVPPQVFKDWILANPGYDVYHIDPFYFNSSQFPNTWVQGERWHPGMLEFCDRLFPIIGIKENVRDLTLKPEEFITANYYVGNADFWVRWIHFLDECLHCCDHDQYCFNYLYSYGGMYNGHWVPNFPFVTERLVTLFVHINKELKIMRYPG